MRHELLSTTLIATALIGAIVAFGGLASCDTTAVFVGTVTTATSLICIMIERLNDTIQTTGAAFVATQVSKDFNKSLSKACEKVAKIIKESKDAD